MFCCKFLKPGRKEKGNAGCTEPQGGPIPGDGAQGSGRKEEGNAGCTEPQGGPIPGDGAQGSGRKEDGNAGCTEPQGGPIPGDGAQGSGRKEEGNAGCTEPQGGPIPGDGAQGSGRKEEGNAGCTEPQGGPIPGDGAQGSASEEVKFSTVHNIFLSHSGAQKPFVEQLCEDLENAGHFPFFDRRPESLPKGENFPELIFQAARQCHVAVVVLSMDYLLSKWPMMELIEFVSARRSWNYDMKILPLYYKVGVEDLKCKHDLIMAAWNKHSKQDSRLDSKSCGVALQVLSAINGEVFAGGSELTYRRAIVDSICRLHPPNVQFDVSAMQGRERLCDVVVAEFDKLCTEGEHARVVGVHGMGGMGKTLLCKALCNIYHVEFAGRVVHVELKGYKDFKQENIIDVQNLILETLCGASVVRSRIITSVQQGNAILENRLRERDVFLALDNVLEGSTEYVQILLHFLSPRSKAIVTSRSLENVRNALKRKPIKIPLVSTVKSIPSKKVSYIRIPALDKDEALKLFLHHALDPIRVLSPFTVKEMEVLETYVKRCFYLDKDQPDSNPMSGHYHPLSLQALGSYLKGIDSREPLQWTQRSKVLQKRSLFYNYSVFDILRAGYDALPTQQDKLIFLDVAVFAPRGKLNDFHELCTWLGAVHGLDQEETLYKVKNLQRNSLIEDWEKNKTLKVTVHDLYTDFAEHQIHLEEPQRWCVYERDGRTLPLSLKSHPPGLRWSSLVRLRLHTASVISFPHEKLLEWANLVVLDINLVHHKSFNISPLKCLRSLKLKSFTLESLTWSDDMEELRYVKLSCERLVQEPDFTSCSNLLELDMRFASAAVGHENIYPLDRLLSSMGATLQVLQLICWIRKFPELLVLGAMANVEVVEIVNDLGFSRPEGSLEVASLSALTRLRRLVLKNLPIWGSLPGLESLISLEDLLLNRCRTLDGLPGLGKLTNLQRLDVSSTAVEELSGVGNLLQLRGLYLVNCQRLKSLPDLQSLGSLKEVFAVGCSSLSRSPRVSELCTLVFRDHKDELLWIWARFLDSFWCWAEEFFDPEVFSVDFERVLSHCPTALASEQDLLEHEELKELSEAFQEAFIMMHRMAGAGRSKKEFDPETDLVICSKIVSLIPEYGDHIDLRMVGKSWYDFLLPARRLRAFLKRYQA